MSDIICVALTVSRTGRREEKSQRQREEGRRERRGDSDKKRGGLRWWGMNDGQADGVMEDDRNEA